MARTLLFTIIMTLAIGCHSEKIPPPLQDRLAEAHGDDSYRRQASLGADIHVEMDDGKVFDARMTYELKGGRCRMQLADNSILVWDGQRAWVSPPAAQPKDAAYHLRHWPMLITLPFQVKEAGMSFSGSEPMELAAAKYDTVKMIRPDGAWFRFYVDAQTELIKGLAYQTKQMERPAAITFYDFDRWEGMTLSREWKFWQWSAEAGLFGKPLGRARVYNIEFVTPKKDAFAAPAGARAVE